jgi:hypothetical protein
LSGKTYPHPRGGAATRSPLCYCPPIARPPGRATRSHASHTTATSWRRTTYTHTHNEGRPHGRPFAIARRSHDQAEPPGATPATPRPPPRGATHTPPHPEQGRPRGRPFAIARRSHDYQAEPPGATPATPRPPPGGAPHTPTPTIRGGHTVAPLLLHADRTTTRPSHQEPRQPHHGHQLEA